MLHCNPAEMRIEDEESIMSTDALDNELCKLNRKWHATLQVICKEEYVPKFRIRQFICLIRNFTKQIDNLQLSVGKGYLFADDILYDIEAITEAFEVLDHFIQRHLDLSKEDVLLYTALKSDLEDHLLHLLYIAEEVKLKDGLLLVICIPTP